MSTLYNFFRSSAAFRVRIALNLKKINYESIPIQLRRAEHKTDSYKSINPMALVPFFVDDMVSVGQSLAIIEYLDERYPEPAILPKTFADRARARSIAQAVACEIHPLNSLRVREYLSTKSGFSDEQVNEWQIHWMQEGFSSIEKILASSIETGIFCQGDEISLADIYLIPQVYNALQAGMDLKPFPTIQRIYNACLKEEAFVKALPENQADAV